MGDIGYQQDPAIISSVAAHLAAGGTQKAIANQLGVDPATTCRIANKPATKELINQIHNDIIAQALAPAKDGIIKLIQDYYKPYDTELDPVTGQQKKTALSLQRKDHGFKAINRLLESVGVFPSHSTSVLIQQIFASGSFDVPEVVKQLLGQITHNDMDQGSYLASEGTTDGDVIDVQAEDISPITQDMPQVTPTSEVE